VIVYGIRHEKGDIYIGSTKTLIKRWYTHYNLLEKCQHHSKALQLKWLRSGKSEWTFCILHELPDNATEADLLVLEQQEIDKAGSNCLNEVKNSSHKEHHREIFERIQAGVPNNEIASEFGVSRSHVSKIGKNMKREGC
jgi:DNA-directed RNA polymerase specialized sigma subunit